MSDQTTTMSTEKKVHGTVAEFTSVDTLLAACRRIRDAGYTKTDAFTPFPVHGIDSALGIKPTVLPWIVLVCGLTGTMTALVMQIWMNGIDYKYIISGKPFISLPAFIPVAFELTILFASFGTFFGMWILNGLPKFSNPVFTDPRFDRVTDDRFFLYIDAKDAQYDQSGVEKLLGDTGSEYIQTVVEDDSEAKVPRFLFSTWVAVVALSIIPLLIVLKMRVTNSPSPRFHVFYDMDFSPSKDAQQSTTLFADARAMRPDVPGTVARGQLDMNFRTGIDMDALAALDSNRAQQLVRLLDEPTDGEAGESDAAEASSEEAQPSVMDTTPWLDDNPVGVSKETLLRGQKYFGIYCSVCHGMNGGGNGLVNRRAQKILAATWVPPSSLHDPTLYDDKYPDGKLFSTISNGIRKMPGYASQIKAEDRWAIVAYVRALQKSQNASFDLVPADKVEELKKKQAEVKEALKKQAEAEAEAAQKK
ncbi:Cytochrome c [Rubripirellula amarantea]|uniref:Cytochrome c n=2 Tax=Rubripirellula amarantea TaxID=2527999 RepID=A0A5C5WTW0_9BACT|nr:quinol:electron acceptor oxidoreductase subunit ActD [Rubripirellula amarantea]TWT53960.1 Cytochrome c [Rubripirellula amarantea]